MGLTLRFTRQLPTPRRMAGWFGCFAGLVGVGSMFQPTMIVGNSMSPTIKNGKMIWIDRSYYRTHQPQRGEVVVFKHLKQTYVKRVYRVADEKFFTLESHGRGFTPIREGREGEVAQRFAGRSSGLRVVERKVPEGHVFVLGDNYFDSVDSRELGPIPVDSILGRAMMPADETVAMSHEFVPPPADKAQVSRRSYSLVAHSH